MNDLLSILYRDFPDFEALRSFQAGIPIYFVKISIEVLEPQQLTSFESYFLHAVALGVNTREEIAYLLGVDCRDLITPGANLLKLGLIAQRLPTDGKTRPIFLTDKGNQALSKNTAPPTPKLKTFNLHFNALTWEPIPLESKTYTLEQMTNELLFSFEKKEHRPLTIGDFSEKDVTFALRGTAAFQNNEIISLIELKKVEAQYLAPVTVILLQHRETGEQRLTVYRNSIQLRSETAEVQRLFESQSFKLPSDATSLKERGLDIPLSLPSKVAQATQNLVQNEYQLKDIEAQLQARQFHRTTTQNDRERQALEDQIKRLQEELQAKRKANEGLRQELLQNQIEFLRTEEHRSILEKALQEAQEEIIIISPWMNRTACDDFLCRLFGNAIARGVHIRIGYGMGKERDQAEADRNRSNVNRVFFALKRYIPKHLENLLEIKETSGTHQKILVCDRKFAVNSSFNWLSYAGKKDDGYRNETGTIFRHINQVKELAEIALQAFSSKDKISRR